jgi:hypothetical protein
MPETTNTKYETTDVGRRTILWPVAGLAILLLVTFLVSVIMLRLWSKPHATGAGGFSARVEPTQAASEPRLQVAPAADLKKLRAIEDARLWQYEWIDRQAGIAAIPIERAMEILAGRAAKGQRPVGPKEPARKEQR